VPEKQLATRRKNTTKRSTDSRTTPGWQRFDAIKDSDIRRTTESDPEAAPILDANWFRKAKIVLPEPKQPVSLRLDRDVLEWFKRQGKGYQTRINAVLRTFIESQR
jgi:uncharacterized protein (DUF4415 family)